MNFIISGKLSRDEDFMKNAAGWSVGILIKNRQRDYDNAKYTGES